MTGTWLAQGRYAWNFQRGMKSNFHYRMHNITLLGVMGNYKSLTQDFTIQKLIKI